MSYFGTTLSELLKRKNMKAVKLAELSGVAQATISRYINFEQLFVDPKDLRSMASAISNDPAEQAELIRAHLMDERGEGPGADLVDVTVGHELRERPAPYLVKLADELEDTFAVIREHVIKNKDVRDIVQGLGNLLSTGDVRTLEESPAVSSSPKTADELSGKLHRQYQKRSRKAGADQKSSK